MIHLRKTLLTLVLLITAVGGAWAKSTYTVTFAANNNTKTVENVTLPKTYQCSYDNADGELDLILKELHGWSWTGNANQTFCDAETTPTSSDATKVVAGNDNGDHYITINNVFEGTVTITGNFVVNNIVKSYSLEISIAAVAPTEWDLTSQDGKNWILDNMPANDIELQVEYYEDPNLAWKGNIPEGGFNAYLGFFHPSALPTIKNPNALTGITYSSSKTDVATVDENTGVVTALKAGSTIITATFAGDENYQAASISYTLNIDNPAIVTLPTSTDEGGTVTLVAGPGNSAQDGDNLIATNANLEGANTSRNIAVDADGNIHVVYKNTMSEAVMYKKSTDGITFSEPVQVSAEGGNECEVAVSSNGKVYVSYTTGQIGYIAYSTDGSSFTSKQVTENDVYSIHLAVDGDYVYGIPQKGTEFYYSADGGQNYATHTGWKGYMYSDVLIDKSNNNVVVIKDDPSVVVRYSTDHGATFTNEQPVMNGAEQLNVFFSTAAAGAGKVFISGAEGTIATVDYINATYTQTTIEQTDNRSLCADEDENVIVGVEQGGSLYYELSTDGAQTFGEKVKVSEGSGANAALNTHDGSLLYLFTKDTDLYLAVKTGVVSTETVIDNGDGTYTVMPGTEVTFTAKANDGYHVASWSNNAEVNDVLEATQTLTVTGDLNISATFAQNPVITLATNDSEMGTVTVEGAGGSGQGSEPLIEWDNNFCANVKACYENGNEQHVEENNTKDGITVTYSDSQSYGWNGGTIDLYYENDILTFTSTVGDISKIEVYYFDNFGDTPNGWTKDETNKKFVWEGTAAAAVDMEGEYVLFTVDNIVFTMESAAASGVIDLGEGKYSVVPGTEITLIAKANDGYHVASWSNNAEVNDPQEATQTLTVTGDLNISATFAENEYNIEFAEGTNTDEWTAAPNPAKTNQKVNVKYTGTRKVMGVKAEKKAKAPAETTANWNSENISFLQLYEPSAPFTMMGIKLSTSSMSNTADWRNIGIPANDGLYFDVTTTGGYTFTAPSGKKFTKIEMTVTNANGWTQALFQSTLGTGWPSGEDAVTVLEETKKVTWTGTAASTVGLLTDASYFNASPVTSIVFTLVDAQ